MANLYYPQLTSGALAQYPIRKTRMVRTIKNVLPDGDLILLADPGAARLVWQLSYTDLSAADTALLQNHFNTCVGPFHAFTFIDPTGNMLVSSSDLTAGVWQTSSLINVTPGAADPNGGSAAFTLRNTGQASQEISQTLLVPSSYQYCFSLYVISPEVSNITLIRRGASTEESATVSIGPQWKRVISTGRLNDPGVTFSVAISLAAGQLVEVFGLQLEAQIAPSRYSPTTQTGGVYAGAHWSADQLTVIAEAPNLFSASFDIETAT
ncbi:MAG: hypothetical protein WB992_05480 [Bryobacteraceae bacterium]